MRIFVTGGAGFIGCNLTARFLGRGDSVAIYDNLSRPRTAHNLDWLRAQPRVAGADFRFVQGDVRDAAGLHTALTDAHPDLVVHLASQVAVTTSVINPREDFEINALGTFNVLEAARGQARPPAVFFASTNKVYGGMEDVAVVQDDTRYRYRDLPMGISEQQPLDFHSPYGCCYSADTDILTRTGWKKFPDLTANDDVLTYSLERGVSEFQKPVAHFAYRYSGKMYVQRNRRLKTCVTPNHKMLVSWDRTPCELVNPKLVEAEQIAGKPMAYLLGADYAGGEEKEFFTLPAVKAGKHKHQFEDKLIPMPHWLRFLGWYLSEGHCYENPDTGNCAVTLTTCYRTEEAVRVMRMIGLSPVVDKHHVVATSRQLYEYVKQFGHSHDKYIPQDIKNLSGRYLRILLTALLDGDGNRHSRNSYRYTTVPPCLADDVQEIALKCGMAASVTRDPEGFCRVYVGTSRTAMCNLGGNRSEWVDYEGPVYCVEVPNSVVMVRQGGYAYFSGNSKGAGDQYVRDYARIYGLRTVVFRQSCIYGERQFGIEDQGWVAHFVIAAAMNRPINIYGNGKQVRDLLYVQDLINAYTAAWERLDDASGQVFNVGGGMANTLAIWSAFGPLLSELAGHPIAVKYGDWRPGDQPVFVSDNGKAGRVLGWTPQVSVKEGIQRLWNWVTANRELFG